MSSRCLYVMVVHVHFKLPGAHTPLPHTIPVLFYDQVTMALSWRMAKPVRVHTVLDHLLRLSNFTASADSALLKGHEGTPTGGGHKGQTHPMTNLLYASAPQRTKLEPRHPLPSAACPRVSQELARRLPWATQTAPPLA